MGSQMAERLRKAGNELRVWNRSPNKAKAWVESGGGIACDSPREAAKGASEVHCMLADDAAVESTLFGPLGVLDALPRSGLVVDHSTVSVAGSKARAEKLALDNWRFLQAPVFASPPNIAQGEGLMLIGGAQETYEAARATLSSILKNHYVVGEKPQDAAAFKLMGNSMLITVVEGLAECYATAKACGISAQRAFGLFEVFNPCGTLSRRGPRMAAGDYKAMFTLTMALKDVQLILKASGNDAMPVLRDIEAKMQRLIREGYENLDLSALGIEVVPPARSGEAH
jgi:3-hydroxyisobutyrate dehydrogenase